MKSRKRRWLPSLRETQDVVGSTHPFTVREAAKWLGVTTRTVDRWSRDPDVDLRASKIGRVIRVDSREVARLIIMGKGGGEHRGGGWRPSADTNRAADDGGPAGPPLSEGVAVGQLGSRAGEDA